MKNKHKGSKFEDYMAEPCGLTHKELSDALNEAELRGEKMGLERAAEICELYELVANCAVSYGDGWMDAKHTLVELIRKAASEIRASCEAGSQRDR